MTFENDYGNVSAKAIRKILPHMINGATYSEACKKAGYELPEDSLSKEERDSRPLNDHLCVLPKNTLRNPVVEKILNQMVHVVNELMETYGRFDEVRIELAREMKKKAAIRNEISIEMEKNRKRNEDIARKIQEEYGFQYVSSNDIVRYKLYEELSENGYKTLYSNHYIPKEELFSTSYDIEHIIPQALLYDDSFANKTLELRTVNLDKGSKTARDYVTEKYGTAGLDAYEKRVKMLHDAGKISDSKYKRLCQSADDIEGGFIQRDIKDTQYITKYAMGMLKTVSRNVTATSGMVTSRLRNDWGLEDVLKELSLSKYETAGMTTVIYDKRRQPRKQIENWSKRNDHRHHAMDAITIAFTRPEYIRYLNNVNAESSNGYVEKAIRNKFIADRKFISPVENMRQEVKKILSSILVSIKSKNKVVTPNVNRTKKRGGTNVKVHLTPRGSLHKETFYGSSKRYFTKEEKVGSAFDREKIMTVACEKYRNALLKRIEEYSGDAKKAFTGKNSLVKNPVWIDDAHTISVPEKVKTVTLETIYTIRKNIDKDLDVKKVTDKGIRRVLENRLAEYGGDPKAAFSDLDRNPIYLDKEKGITIKKVTITGVANAQALRDKRDKDGHLCLDKDGNKQPVDYVSLGNNHHVAIYEDANGDYQESVVSFFQAVNRALAGETVIDRHYKEDEGWKFLFSMKRNEYFVFPSEDFDPHEIDLTSPSNKAIISKHLYRVQKLATKYYVFRHHLETTVEDNNKLKDITWKRIISLNNLKGIVKVRVSHTGDIVTVGEY